MFPDRRATAQLRGRQRAFTLVELTLALAIVAVVSVAVAGLITGAAKAQAYVTSTGDAVWQIENTCRRMSYNLAAASSLVAPAGTTASNTFTITTQPDASNGNTTYSVTYAISGTNLQETDTRFGTNTIARNISSFSVQRLSVSTPVSVTITLTSGEVTRTFTVLCRNL